MEPSRYRPADAMRWLEIGAEDVRKNAQRQSVSVVRREGERSFARDIRQAAGAIVGLGKSALADLAHSNAFTTEYALYEDRFEVIKAGGIKSYRYDDVRSMRQGADRVTLVFEQGSLVVKPLAHLVTGRVRVPLGWSRNGLDVPYHVLIDELAARCGISIDQS